MEEQRAGRLSTEDTSGPASRRGHRETKAQGSEASPGKPGAAHIGKQKREPGRHLARSFPSSTWKLPSPGSFPRALGGRAHSAHRPPQPAGQREWQRPAEVGPSRRLWQPWESLLVCPGSWRPWSRWGFQAVVCFAIICVCTYTSGRSIWSLLLFSRLCPRKPINQTNPSPPGLRV